MLATTVQHYTDPLAVRGAARAPDAARSNRRARNSSSPPTKAPRGRRSPATASRAVTGRTFDCDGHDTNCQRMYPDRRFGLCARIRRRDWRRMAGTDRSHRERTNGYICGV